MCISGSTNQKVSNVVDHATSDVRKVGAKEGGVREGKQRVCCFVLCDWPVPIYDGRDNAGKDGAEV